jgi:hypothetical protein
LPWLLYLVSLKKFLTLSPYKSSRFLLISPPYPYPLLSSPPLVILTSSPPFLLLLLRRQQRDFAFESHSRWLGRLTDDITALGAQLHGVEGDFSFPIGRHVFYFVSLSWDMGYPIVDPPSYEPSHPIIPSAHTHPLPCSRLFPPLRSAPPRRTRRHRLRPRHTLRFHPAPGVDLGLPDQNRPHMRCSC